MKNHEWKSFVSYKEAIERVHCHSIAPTISWIWPQSNCKKREIIWTFYSRSLTWHIDVSAREISIEGLLNKGVFESILCCEEKLQKYFSSNDPCNLSPFAWFIVLKRLVQLFLWYKIEVDMDKSRIYLDIIDFMHIWLSSILKFLNQRNN